MKRVLFFAIIIIIVAISWFLRGTIFQSIQKVPSISELRGKDITVIAHRGASAYAPENTMVAFKKAMEMGAEIIELDVHLSKDKELIVIHDESLERTTNGNGLVRDFTLEELQKLDAGTWYGDDFANEALPTLEEVLKMVNGQCTLLIEIKGAKDYFYDGLSEKLMDLIQQYEAQNWCIVQSFEPLYLEVIHGMDSNIELQYLIFTDFSPFNMYLGTSVTMGDYQQSIYAAINPFYKSLTQGKIESIHQAGFKTFTYTVNEEEDMKKLIALGVDGIITDYPDKLISLRNQIKSIE